jgi:hypothetical protein
MAIAPTATATIIVKDKSVKSWPNIRLVLYVA